MRVRVIATNLTLADSVPALGEHADRARAELKQALAAAVELALRLPREPIDRDSGSTRLTS
jgi:hypothetical protein